MAIIKSFEDAKAKGFIFPGARGWMQTENIDRMKRIAQDAALITTPNSTVPAEFTAYFDPKVIEILTASRNAKKIFPETKKGDWATAYAKFRMEEYVGSTTPYQDFADGASADINATWPTREQYRFQTTIKYGDLETDISSLAKLNLAASKQRAAARIIDIDSNRFYLKGVAGKEIYGLLNDPNLDPALAPASIGGVTAWKDKTAVQIYNDILALSSDLRTKSGGNVNEDSKMVLAVSPASSSLLSKVNDLGLSVRDMLRNEFNGNIEIVALPELYQEATSDSLVYLIAKDIAGIPTGELGFGEKYRAGRVIPRLSSFEQKVSATTYGAIIYYPFAISRMSGC